VTLAFGLVGCGGMGRRHVLGMQRLKQVGRLGFDLAAVCDVAGANAAEVAGQAQDLLGRRPEGFDDLDAMLRGVRLDGLLVTTTPETHAAVALAAFAADVDVLVEKPLTLTVAEGVSLVKAAREAGRTLAVAENYRRDPINRLGQALVAAGAVGRPFLAAQHASSGGEYVIITPWRHRRDRGGIVLDMGVHYADILEYYLGPVEAVAGMSTVVDQERLDAQGTAHPADAEDVSLGVLRFRSGALGNWLLNLAGRGEPSFARIIYGTGGSLSVPGDRLGQPLRLFQRRAGQDVAVPPDEALALVPEFALEATTAALFGGERLTTYDLPWTAIDANLLAIEQADFVEALAGGRAPEVDGEQGLRSVALVAALLEAGRMGRVVGIEEVLAERLTPRPPHHAAKDKGAGQARGSHAA
jgi:predicted dehydrogenase